MMTNDIDAMERFTQYVDELSSRLERLSTALIEETPVSSECVAGWREEALGLFWSCYQSAETCVLAGTYDVADTFVASERAALKILEACDAQRTRERIRAFAERN